MTPRFLILLFTCLVAIGCNNDDDAGDIIDTATTSIPDPVFEQFLIDNGYDDVLDGKVLQSNISGVTELDMTDIPVASLVGLQDFSALRKFLVRSFQLTSFNPNPNTELRYLSTNGCLNLEALDVSALVQLDTLYMSNNNTVVSLDVSTNNRLKSLHVIAANLESIVLPQGETTQFIDLILYNTKLTQIDLSPFEELELLRIDDSSFEVLDVSANPQLLTVECSGNPLTTLNLANGANGQIESMDARNTNLSCIQIDAGCSPPTDGSWQKDSVTEYSDNCG